MGKGKKESASFALGYKAGYDDAKAKYGQGRTISLYSSSEHNYTLAAFDVPADHGLEYEVPEYLPPVRKIVVR
jgi:hypothetical protein